jgi:D-amino-acid dehydrogenase
MRAPRVGVVGGGVVGASAAFHLAKGGAHVVWFDEGHPGRATWAGAGIVSAETSAVEHPRLLSFFREAQEALRRLATSLGPERVGYGAMELLVVATPQDPPQAWEVRTAQLALRARQWDLGDDLREVSEKEARARFPLMGPMRGAWLSRRAARVDGRRLTDTLDRAAREMGAQRAAKADGLSLRGAKVDAVRCQGERVPVDAVVVAAGAWSRSLLQEVGVDLDVTPQRGQLVCLQWGQEAGGWAGVHALDGHYLLPWPEGQVTCGATREDDSGFSAHLTAGGQWEVLHHALSLAPRLAQAQVREWRVGLRPKSGDGLPYLGRVSSVEGLVVATGMGASGLLLGPYAGSLAAQLATGQAPEEDLAAFAPDRGVRPHSV